jgi:ribokinase
MILVIGSANIDFVTQAPDIPRAGETVLGRSLTLFPGGKGANQAVACAKAGGAETHFLSAMGSDMFAETLKGALQAAGVFDHSLPLADEPTGSAFICVSDHGENAITVVPGANFALTPERAIQAARPLLARADCRWILLQSEIPTETNTALASLAKAAGIRVTLNAAPASDLPDALLATIDILIVNAIELETIVSQRAPGLTTIADQIRTLPTPTVVVTLGAEGCWLKEPDGTQQQTPAFSVAAIDTTGAGDAFAGAFVAAIDQGATSQEAVRFASAVGAIACTALGAQSSTPTREAVDAFLRRHAP